MARPDEVIIIMDQSCEPCGKIKTLLQDQVDVRFIDLQSEEADQLLGDRVEVLVPLPVARFGEERKICELRQQDEAVLLVCNDEVIPLKE